MFLSQSIISVVAKLGTMACMFLINAILFRTLSINDYGYWALGFGLIPFMILFDFGIGFWFQNQVLRPDGSQFSRALLFFGVASTQLAIAMGLISLLTVISLLFSPSFIPPGFIYFAFLVCIAGFLGVSDRYLASKGFNYIQEIQQFIVYLAFTFALIGMLNKSYLANIKDLALLFAVIYFIVKIAVLLTVSIDQAKVVGSLSSFEFNVDSFFLYLKKGQGFFAAQVWALIFYNIDRYLIASIYGVSEVAIYEPIYRYCSVVLSLAMVFYRPLWSEISRFHMKGFTYLNSISNVIKLSIFSFIFLAITMIFLAKVAFKIWLGDSFLFLWTNLILIMFNILVCVFIVIFSYILNGIDKPKSQALAFITAIFIKLCGVYWLVVKGTDDISDYLIASLISVTFCFFIMLKTIRNNEYT